MLVPNSFHQSPLSGKSLCVSTLCTRARLLHYKVEVSDLPALTEQEIELLMPKLGPRKKLKAYLQERAKTIRSEIDSSPPKYNEIEQDGVLQAGDKKEELKDEDVEVVIDAPIRKPLLAYDALPTKVIVQYW